MKRRRGRGARLLEHGPPTAVQQATLSLVEPENLPCDPETPHAQDRAGLTEPADARPECRRRRTAR